VAVVGVEEQAAGRAARHQVEQLRPRLLVEHRRAGHGHQRQRDVVLAGNADRQPAEVAHLGNGDVLAHLHPQLVRVEGERLLLVVHPDVHIGQ